MKICLMAVGNYNVGDNAILNCWLAILNQFLRPEDIVYVLGIETSYITQYAEKYRFRLVATNALYRSFSGCSEKTEMDEKLDELIRDPANDCFSFEAHQLHRIFAEIDLLHIIGGGIINGMWLDMQFLTMAAIRLAKRYHVHVMMTGQTLGPFHEEDEKRLIPYFKEVDLIDLRDNCPMLKKQEIDYQVTVDDALAYLQMTDEGRAFPKELESLAEKRFITICLQSWELAEVQQKQYSAARQNLAQFLHDIMVKDSDVHVCFLEFMHLDHDKENSLEVYQLLEEELRSRCHFITCSNYYPLDVAAFVGKAEFCVTTRLHLSIFSMMAGVPVYSIVLDPYYRQKMEGAYCCFDVHQTYELSACLPESFMRSYTSKRRVGLTEKAREAVRKKYQAVLNMYLRANRKHDLLLKMKLKRLLLKL